MPDPQTMTIFSEKILCQSVADLDLSRRSLNSLLSRQIICIGQLVHMTHTDLLCIPSFGQVSLREVIAALARNGLSLGMSTEDEHLDEEQTTPDSRSPEVKILHYLRGLTVRDRQTLRKRVLKGGSTLEELGQTFNVTREAVRQIEKKLKTRIRNYLGRPDCKDIRSYLATVREDLGSTIPIGSIHEYWRTRSSNTDASDEDQEFILEFVLWTAGPYTELSGWLVRSGDLVTSTVSALHGRLDMRGWLSSAAAKDELNKANISEKYHALWMADQETFWAIDGGWLPLRRTIPDRAEQLIRYAGVPMLAETLCGSVGCESERSLRQRLLEDSRFKRISRQGHFALREWPQYDEYTGIADEIAEEIERQGGGCKASATN
jgi:Bacterial RNA polymerase, alpha chain C terminal domain/Sigma-70, region 4